MSQLMPSPSPQVLPESAVQHAGRWQRLQEDRRFRVEQLAALDAELADCRRPGSAQLALRIAATTALCEIDAVLARIAEGAYGLCVSCARPMPDSRLDVFPSAPLCMACHLNGQNCQSRDVEQWRS